LIFPTFGGHLRAGILALNEGVYGTQRLQAVQPGVSNWKLCAWLSLGEKPKAQTARDLGIRVNQLRKWRLDFELEDRTGAPKPAVTAEDDLRASGERRPAPEEIELLKKAAIYFARGTR